MPYKTAVLGCTLLLLLLLLLRMNGSGWGKINTDRIVLYSRTFQCLQMLTGHKWYVCTVNWTMIQAANVMVRHDDRPVSFYQKSKTRHGGNHLIVITYMANKM